MMYPHEHDIAATRSTLWERVASELILAIKNGTYPIGSLLPTEHELMNSYSVSRHTIRTALAYVQQQGLVRRTPHVGTTVISTGERTSWRVRLHDLKDIDTMTQLAPRELIDVEYMRLTSELQSYVPFPIGTAVTQLSFVRRHPHNYRPYAFTKGWVVGHDEGLVDVIRHQPGTTLIELLEMYAGIRCLTIEQSVKAVPLDDFLAKMLLRPERSPALSIVRRYFDAKKKLLAVSTSFYPYGENELTYTIERAANSSFV